MVGREIGTLDFEEDSGEGLTDAEKAVVPPYLLHKKFVKENPQYGLQNPVIDYDNLEGDLMNDRVGPKPAKIKRKAKTKSVLKGNIDECVNACEDEIASNVDNVENKSESNVCRSGDGVFSVSSTHAGECVTPARRDRQDAEVQLVDSAKESGRGEPQKREPQLLEKILNVKQRRRKRRTEIFARTSRNQRKRPADIDSKELILGSVECQDAVDHLTHYGDMSDDLVPLNYFQGEFGLEEGYESATEGDAGDLIESLGGGKYNWDGDEENEDPFQYFPKATPRNGEANNIGVAGKAVPAEPDVEMPQSYEPHETSDDYTRDQEEATVLNAFIDYMDKASLDSKARRIRKRPQKPNEILVVGERPYVDVDFNMGGKLAALIDSGSSSCAITRQFLDELIRAGVKVVMGTAKYTVRSFGSNHPVKDIPVIYIDLKIGSHEIKHAPFLVNSGGNPPALLGQNLFTHKRWSPVVSADGEHHYLLGMISNGRFGRIEDIRMMHTNTAHEVRLAETVTLYPRQEVKAMAYIPTIPRIKRNPLTRVAYQITGIEDGAGLVPGHTWCWLKNGNKCEISLLNNSDLPVVLRAHDYVAKAKPMPDSEIETNYVAMSDVRQTEKCVAELPQATRSCRCPERGEEDHGKIMFANRFGAGFLKAYDLMENGERSYLQNVAMLDRVVSRKDDTFIMEDVYDTFHRAMRELATDGQVEKLFPRDRYIVQIAHNEPITYQKMAIIQRISRVKDVVIHRIRNVYKCRSCASIGGDDLLPYLVGVNRTCIHFSGTRDVNLPDGKLVSDRESPKRTYEVMGNFVTIHRQDQKIGIYVHLRRDYFTNRFDNPHHKPLGRAHLKNALYMIMYHIGLQKLTSHVEISCDELVSQTKVTGLKTEIMQVLTNISPYEQRKITAKWVTEPKSTGYKYPPYEIDSCDCVTCHRIRTSPGLVRRSAEPIPVFSGNFDNLEKGILYKEPTYRKQDEGKCDGVTELPPLIPDDQTQSEIDRLYTADLLYAVIERAREKLKGARTDWIVKDENGGLVHVTSAPEGGAGMSDQDGRVADVAQAYAEQIGEYEDYDTLGFGKTYNLLSEYPVSFDTDAIEQNAHRVRSWRLGIDSGTFPEEVKGELEKVLDRYEGILAHHKNEWRHLNVEPIHLEFADDFESFVDRSHFVSADKSQVLDRKIEALLDARMIRVLSQEEVQSPLLCVSSIFLAVQNSQVKLDRKNGKVADPTVYQNAAEDRMIVDARKINQGLKVAPASEIAFKSVNEVITKFSGMKHCIILDIQKCYRLVPIDQESQLRLGFASPHSRRYQNSTFAFRSLVDGLRTSPSIVHQIFSDCIRDIDHVVNYLDDIIILGRTKSEVVQRFEQVCKKLEGINALVSAKKIQFFPKKFEFLGFEFDLNDGNPKYGLSQERKDSYAKLTMPKTLLEAQGFVGTANFACYYVPGLYLVMAPLLDMLAQNIGKRKFEYTTLQEKAFEKTKEALMGAENLYVFDFSKPAVLVADASMYGYGSVLMQESPVPGEMQIVKYSSKRFPRIIQCGKNIAFKELLAQIQAYKDFEMYLRNCKRVTMLTDSALMIYCMKTSYVALSDSLSRLLHQFWSLPVSFKIKNVPRKYLMLPDWLSKRHSNHTITGHRFFSAEEAEAYFGEAMMPVEWEEEKEFTYRDVVEHFEKIIREQDNKSSERVKEKRVAGLKMAIEDARNSPPQHFGEDFALGDRRLEHPVPIGESRPPLKRPRAGSSAEHPDDEGLVSDAKSARVMAVDGEVDDEIEPVPIKPAKGHFGKIHPPYHLASEVTVDYLADIQRRNEFCASLILESRKRTPGAKAKYARKFRVIDGDLVVTRHKNKGPWDAANIRIYIPPRDAFEIMAKIHLTSGHANSLVNARMFNRSFATSSVYHKAQVIAKHCLGCKLFEYPINKNNPPGRLPYESSVGERYYIDVVNLHRWYDVPDDGYTPEYYMNPFKNALAILDSRSNFVECVGLKSDGEGEIIKALRDAFRLLPVHPNNSTIISDNASNLCANAQVRDELKRIGFTNILNSSAYISSSNARVERWFRSFRRTLDINKYCYDTTNYGDVFYQSVRQLNNRPISFLCKKGTMLTPYEVFYGQRPPYDVTQAIIDQGVISNREKYRQDIDKIIDDYDKAEQEAHAEQVEGFEPRQSLRVGDLVLKEEPMSTRKDGRREKSLPRYEQKLYTIIRMGPNGFRAQVKDVLSDTEVGKKWVSKNQLKLLNEGEGINQFLTEDTLKLLGRYHSDEEINAMVSDGSDLPDLLKRKQESGDGPPLKQRLRGAVRQARLLRERARDPLDQRLRRVGVVKNEVETEEDEWIKSDDNFDFNEMPSDDDEDDELQLDLPANIVEPSLPRSTEPEGGEAVTEENNVPMEVESTERPNVEEPPEAMVAGDEGANDENGEGANGPIVDPGAGETTLESSETPTLMAGENQHPNMEGGASEDEAKRADETSWEELEDELPPREVEDQGGPATRTRSRKVTFADTATEQPYRLRLGENLKKRSRKRTMKEIGLHALTKMARPFQTTLPRALPASQVPLTGGASPGEAQPRRSSRDKRPVRRLISED